MLINSNSVQFSYKDRNISFYLSLWNTLRTLWFLVSSLFFSLPRVIERRAGSDHWKTIWSRSPFRFPRVYSLVGSLSGICDRYLSRAGFISSKPFLFLIIASTDANSPMAQEVEYNFCVYSFTRGLSHSAVGSCLTESQKSMLSSG